MQPDQYGRTVSYLRLSITDRCNLRCFYCRGGKKLDLLRHEEILRYEEMLQLIGVARDLGVRKVRLTGGEPMVRKDFVGFLERILTRYPNLDLRLTTNGTLLPGKARILKEYGLECVNISLDSLRPDVYQQVTGRNHYSTVRQAIDECLENGLKVKINAVALRTINDYDLGGFIQMAREAPLDVRFIEFMPMGHDTAWKEDFFWSAKDILHEAGLHADLVSIDRNSPDRDDTSGPARVYGIAGGKGRFGVISPLSDHFCGSCNRLRVTSDGWLRTCLFSDRQYRLRPLLRHPRLGVDKVREVIKRAGQRKPLGYMLLAQAAQNRTPAVCNSHMNGIGG